MIKKFCRQTKIENTVIAADADIHAFAVQLNTRLADNLSISLTQAYLHEQGSTLNSLSEGAFKLSDVTKTFGLTTAVNADLPLSIKGKLHYTEAMTNLNSATGSLFTDYSTLNSRAFGFSLLRNSVLTYDDRIGISISRPLRGEIAGKAPWSVLKIVLFIAVIVGIIAGIIVLATST